MSAPEGFHMGVAENFAVRGDKQHICQIIIY